MNFTLRRIGAIIFAIGFILEAVIVTAVYYRWQVTRSIISLTVSPFLIITGLWCLVDKNIGAKYPTKIIYTHFIGLSFIFIGATLNTEFSTIRPIGSFLFLAGFISYLIPLFYGIAHPKKS